MRESLDMTKKCLDVNVKRFIIIFNFPYRLTKKTVKNIFGSDMSSRNANVRLRSSVRLVQTCLEQSIFTFLGQRAIRALKEPSEDFQGAYREQSWH